MKSFHLLFLFSLFIVGSAYSNPLPKAKGALVFPVSGKKAKVGSFWGAYREGGRKHKGIDIFAKKGTPILSVADGFVSSIGSGGKGGKVVWVRSIQLGFTAYYAHLDKQSVKEGQFVKKGQLIGTVGNTGNAKYTPSHLHFGIYTSKGAVNPYPYVKNSPRLTSPIKPKAVLAKNNNSNKSTPATTIVKQQIPSSVGRVVENGTIDKKYIARRIELHNDGKTNYFVTTGANVVKLVKGKLQVIGKWKKNRSTRYPYTIEFSNSEKLFVSKSGKLTDASGKQIGVVSSEQS